MSPRLKTIFHEAESTRKMILQLVDSASVQRLSYAPEGKWSISQILSHIIAAERLSLSYMKKKALGIDSVGDTGLVEHLAFIFLKVSQRLPLKYKAPEVLRSTPEKLSIDRIKHEWNSVRKETKEFLEQIRDDQIRRKIYKHAVAGRLNVMQAISFFNEHANHHLPQIKDLLKRPIQNTDN